MEIYTPEADDILSDSAAPLLCEIEAGKKYPFSICLSFTMKVYWKRILSSTGVNLLVLLAFDLFYFLLIEDPTPFYILLNVSLSILLVLINFFANWLILAKKMQESTERKTGAVTRIYTDRFELCATVILPAQLFSSSTSSIQKVSIPFTKIVQIHASKKTFLVTAIPQGMNQTMNFLILRDERLNSSATTLLLSLAKERKSSQSH